MCTQCKKRHEGAVRNYNRIFGEMAQEDMDRLKEIQDFVGDGLMKEVTRAIDESGIPMSREDQLSALEAVRAGDDSLLTPNAKRLSDIADKIMEKKFGKQL